VGSLPFSLIRVDQRIPLSSSSIIKEIPLSIRELMMDLCLFPTQAEMALAAAGRAASLLAQAIAEGGEASLVLATGASQLEMISHLVTLPVDWSKVTAFHLDEYLGLPLAHPASFRRYLQERFAAKVPGLRAFHYVDGEASDARRECRRLEELIRRRPVDLACIGIGENGHLAFNDPPADFEIEDPYIVVDLDEACRCQQVGEGWFPDLQSVPRQAISMSICQIMQSKAIVCTVPDGRKAEAVRRAVEGPVTNRVPASILQQHPNCWLYLDKPAASLLNR
jgi:glucosamine-6-phosphate deaminase